MEIITIVGIVILLAVLVTVAKFLIHSIRTVFYVLLVTLALVFLFGVSYSDLFDWVVKIILLVF